MKPHLPEREGESVSVDGVWIGVPRGRTLLYGPDGRLDVEQLQPREVLEALLSVPSLRPAARWYRGEDGRLPLHPEPQEEAELVAAVFLPRQVLVALVNEAEGSSKTLPHLLREILVSWYRQRKEAANG